MKFKILMIIFTILSLQVLAQEIFHQNVFHGGVTAGGFSTGRGTGSGNLKLHIEPGSVIKKAYLFTYSIGHPPLKPIVVNNKNYYFDTLNHIMDVEIVNHPSGKPIRLYYNDITLDLNTYPTDSFNITIPVINETMPMNWGWWTAFIYIEYENFNLPIVASNIWVNDKDFDFNISSSPYQMQNMNYIDTNYPVALSLYTDRVSHANPTKVFVNTNYLGTIKYSDSINKQWDFAGVKGHFYYQNNTLFALDDDTTNITMNNSDGLADISSYLLNHNSYNLTLPHQNISPDENNNVGRNNEKLLFINAYTTPCDTFSVSVTPDTTICYGEQVQLQVTGGLTYEWSASTASQDTSSSVPGLSCSDCPNPIFTGEHSMSYSVRIWNNDSCSVVRPVRINVSRPQKVNCYTGETKCGASTGYIKANALPEDLDAWYVVTPNNDTLDQPIGNTFPNLGAGDYSVYYIDSLGCKSEDTNVTIEAYNNTVADFSVNPTTGSVPLEVEINNQSQNATDFEWLINGVSSGTSPTTFFDTSGVYEIGLVAWEIDASCADTTWKTVLVFDSLMAQLPNVFTPNNDGINDFFNVKVNLPVSYKLSILNRWGNVVFENEGGLAEGTHKLWDGTAENGDFVTDGTYFYTISFALDNEAVDCEVTECEVRKDGFVQVFGE